MPDSDIETLARGLFGQLLMAGEKQAAGVSSRAPALAPYRELRSLAEKEAFEAVLKAARAAGAVTLTWPADGGEFGFVQRVDLVDTGKLAACLGVDTQASRLEVASEILARWQARFTVIEDVLTSWGQLVNVRSLGPESAQDYSGAASVIAHLEDTRGTRPVDQPIREFSARIFRDSKRIERLAIPLAILLAGDLKLKRREAAEIWQEIGRFRETATRVSGSRSHNQMWCPSH